MNIFVIGHSVLDHISSGENFRFQPGGIFYTALALSTLKKEDDVFDLCTGIEKDALVHFEPAFKHFSVRHCPSVERIPRVHLTIFADAERCERFENLDTKLEIPFSELNSYDAIFINMISGFDINLEDLIKIREVFKGIIYFDVHSLSRGLGSGMVRELRTIPGFINWAARLNIIQANENEVLTLSTKTDVQETAEELLHAGLDTLIVTKGEKGADLYYLENGELQILFEPALKTDVINKVGCGDVFGAYYFYNFLKTNDRRYALKVAAAAGSIVTQFDSFDKYSTLANEVYKRFD